MHNYKVNEKSLPGFPLFFLFLQLHLPLLYPDTHKDQLLYKIYLWHIFVFPLGFYCFGKQSKQLFFVNKSMSFHVWKMSCYKNPLISQIQSALRRLPSNPNHVT